MKVDPEHLLGVLNILRPPGIRYVNPAAAVPCRPVQIRGVQYPDQLSDGLFVAVGDVDIRTQHIADEAIQKSEVGASENHRSQCVGIEIFKKPPDACIHLRSVNATRFDQIDHFPGGPHLDLAIGSIILNSLPQGLSLTRKFRL